MKPKYPHYKTVIASLIAVAVGGIFFASCKKDSSVETTDQTADSAVASQAWSGSSNQAPKSKAGSDQTITLPVNSVNFDGSSSYDPDGSIASYSWTKEVGGTATIASPTSAKTAITGLAGGSYRFRLTVKDNKGATGSDTIHVTVNGTGTGGGGGTGNQAPAANAGSDKTITLPTNSVTLSGSGTDADGTIASYLWSKVSGSGGTIASSTSASTNITGLTAGSYVFSLKVTDNSGATATDNVTVTVNNATQTGGGTGDYSGYTLVYSTGYDDVNSIDPFGHGQWGSGSQADHLSTSLYKVGPGSFKSVPANVSSGIRSEVQYGSAQSPLEGIVEYDVYYDNFFANSGHSLQWHPTTSGGSGTGLYHKNGQLQFVTVKSGTSGTNVGSPFSVSTKAWHHIKLTYKFGTSGYIKVELDGVERVNSNVQMGDGSAPYLKVGVNMWENQTSVVYYDNLKVYKKG